MTNSREKREIEKEHGPLREALLSRLQAGKAYKDIAREWDVHYNTIVAWVDEMDIERRVVYVVRHEEAVGVPG